MNKIKFWIKKIKFQTKGMKNEIYKTLEETIIEKNTPWMVLEKKDFIFV